MELDLIIEYIAIISCCIYSTGECFDHIACISVMARIYTLKTKSSNNANFVVIGGTGGCHDDNLWCCQWQQMWHHDD